MNHKVRILKVPMFEIVTDAGESLGFFKEVSEWNGLTQLKHVVTHADIIVSKIPDPGEVIGWILGKGTAEQTHDVIKCAPTFALPIVKEKP